MSGDASEHVIPFVLAGLGALVYGGVSAFMNMAETGAGKEKLCFIILALVTGGVVSATQLLATAVIAGAPVAPSFALAPLIALLAYSALLPGAHLAWLTAVQNPKVPAFASAFLVPVLATGVLALAVKGQAGPEVLSALVLVMCGIAFAAAREQGIPVGFAVTLAFLASIQVSQALAHEVTGPVDAETGLLAQLIAAVIAIFAGFVLTNAIRRHDTLQAACGRFYAKAGALSRDAARKDGAVRELEALESMVLSIGPEPRAWQADHRFGPEWAEIDLALTNRVSPYEWSVLLLGGGGLTFALHAFALSSTSAATVLLRAFGVAVVVGVLFTVRDYDRHRPERLCQVLAALRRRYGFTVDEGSPIAQRLPPALRPLGKWAYAGLAILLLVAMASVVLNAGA